MLSNGGKILRGYYVEAYYDLKNLGSMLKNFSLILI